MGTTYKYVLPWKREYLFEGFFLKKLPKGLGTCYFTNGDYYRGL